MSDRWPLTILAVAGVVGLAPACGTSKAAGTPQDVCDDYFGAITGVACGETAPPAAEVARVRALFETFCEHVLALPGNGVTTASLESCATAMKATGCRRTDISECSFQGTLSSGAPCNDSSQCQSGNCASQLTGTSDAGLSSSPCGACAPGIAVGQPCAAGDACVVGALCDGTGTGYTCTLVTYGGVGANCDGFAANCKTGLYCDLPVQQCASPGSSGAACTTVDACAPPLVCSGGTVATGLTCQALAPVKAACQTDQDCAYDLGCSSATLTCAPLTWISQGQPCGDVARCLIGNCPVTGGPGGGSASGTCPIVVADGEPCTVGDASHTCDTISSCTNAVCQQLDSIACK